MIEYYTYTNHLKKIFILIITLCSLSAFGQELEPILSYNIDSIMIKKDYTVYRGDTFNLKDGKGQINGSGIWFIMDSTVRKGIASFVIYTEKGTGKIKCTTQNQPDEISLFIEEVLFGTMINSKKEGKWISYYKNGKVRLEMNLINDTMQLPIQLMYDTGEIMYKGLKINEDNVIFRKYSRLGTEGGIISWPKDFLYSLD